MQTTHQIRTYQAPIWAKNPHFQTIAPRVLWRRSKARLQWQQFELNDGDFVDLAWQNQFANDDTRPILLLLHGLHGCAESPYIKSLMQVNAQLGWRMVVMHQRGCSGRANRFWRSYHSGETDDLGQVVQMIKQRFPLAPLFAVGYSMGGNILLNYLIGEPKNPIQAAISVSAPLKLGACADAINKGFSKVYQRYLISLMRSSLVSKHRSHPNRIEHLKLRNSSTFWDFDNVYTAPVHGFVDAADYYQQCSPKTRMATIKTPHLVVHSQDDPFMNHEVLLEPTQVSSHGQYLLTQSGGHVGFLEGEMNRPQSWLNHVIPSYFKSQLE
ncbi:hydrolase [Alginatibacterium sediminis]|uniref:Hydrolase n=1 Tax=Alginatibacterium sediminis TaxID=2164068 RepID=A0A420EKV3_9ALTE|nr:hydrolase [Alginatibacterium sediminis]RKF21318.1 hydrolase [Alginatibacterium sediminis]